MRQGQQNRRGRGRNHNHQQRKSQNPLSRSFESNGPDVKLRGTPNHIAEKYLSLARDALSSGDPVLAENYLQHAEHYNRIIMAYREQNLALGGGDPSQGGNGEYGEQVRTATETGLGALDSETGEEGLAENSELRGPSVDLEGGQESGSSQYESHGSRMHQDQSRSHHQHQGRGDFHERRDRRDRHEGRDRNERRDRHDHRFDRRDRRDRFDRYQPQNLAGEPRSDNPQNSQRRERNAGDRLPQDVQEQPEFLRRSVRRARQSDEGEDTVSSVGTGKENGKR
ncbi:MAG: DUF4167 domain-containing protein [Hyphomicrobium sp.]